MNINLSQRHVSSLNQGLFSLALSAGEMKDPRNEVGVKLNVTTLLYVMLHKTLVSFFDFI